MTIQFRIFPESFCLHVVALEEIATAEVDSVPSSPITALPVTNETAGWVDNSGRRYYQIRRASGGALVRAGEGRMNETPELEVFGVRNGDPGIEGREKLLDIEAGDIIYVFRQRVAVPTASRIDGSDFLKLWSVPFNTSQPQTQYPSPQPNYGTDVSAIADPDTGVARLTFDAFQTGRETFAWSGTTPDILWNTADGTIVGGYSDTDPVVEYDFPPGQHLMRLRVDDTGAGAPDSDPSSTGKRNVFVRGAGFTAFSDLVAVTAIVESHDITGRSMTFTIECDAGLDLSAYLYAGADVFFTYTIQTKSGDTFSNLAGTVNSFKGYLAEFPEVYRDYRGIVRYQLRVENPLQFFTRLGINSQVLQVASPPTNWLEVHPDLANLGFVAYYLLEYNAASLLNVIDFIPGDFVNYFFPDFSFRGSSLTGALRNAAAMRPYGTIGCLSDGAVIMRDHPWMMNDTYRTNLGTVRTWTAGELREKISFPRSPIPKYSRTKANFFVQDGDITNGYTNEANLLAPGYGERPTEIPDFLATSETEGAQVLGDAHAYLNRPSDLPVETTGMIDVFDLAEMKPHQGDVAAFDPLSLPIWGDKFLPVSVTRQWSLTTEHDGKTIFDPRFTIAFNAEPETKGVPAPQRDAPELGEPPVQTWCRRWTPNDPDFQNWIGALANYIAGDGWSYVDQTTGDGRARRLAQIYREFTEANVTEITFTYRLTKGNIDEVGTQCLIIATSPVFETGTIENQSYNATSNTSLGTFTWTGSQSMSAIRLFAASSRDENSPFVYGGDVAILSVTTKGTGPMPPEFGGSNC